MTQEGADGDEECGAHEKGWYQHRQILEHWVHLLHPAARHALPVTPSAADRGRRDRAARDPAAMTPAAMTPAAMTPAAMTPAAMTPAAMTPAAGIPAAAIAAMP
jgi:hypothetical protein